MASAGLIPPYEFVQTVKSRSNSKNKDSPGVLVIENSMTHYVDKLKNKTAYYVCSNKRSTGCSATAVVTKIETEDVKSGEKIYRYILSKWDPLEYHNHEGDLSGVVAEKFFMEMAAKVEVGFENNLTLFLLKVPKCVTNYK